MHFGDEQTRTYSAAIYSV